MKICSKCKTEKSLDEFPVNRTKKDGRGYSCKSCHAEYTRSHYLKSKDQYKERNTRRRKEARDYVTNFKKNNQCQCGEDRWWVLEFHHPNKDKEGNVSNLVNSGIAAVKREIDKCIVLCANCHKDLHYKE